MAVKKYKPTSAARRFITTADFSGITKKDPEKSLLEVRKKHSGRNNNGHITTRHKGGGTRKQYRIIDFKRSKDAHPGEGRGDRVRSEPHRAHRAAALPRRREALHPRAGRSRGRRAGGVRPGRRHQDRQRAAAHVRSRSAPSSTTSSCARARAEARALGRLGGAADGEGRHVRAGPHAVGRSAQDPDRAAARRSDSSGTSITRTR